MSSSSQQTLEGVPVPWSVIYSTLATSVAIGVAGHVIFALVRSHKKKKDQLTPYETRQYTLKHRSPPPYEGNALWGWAMAAYRISDEDALTYMGLDMFMFIRMLRMGFRIAVVGSILGSILLMPVYGTGDLTGDATEEFNTITAAKVEQSDGRLWATALVFCSFCAYTMHLLYSEWKNIYSPRRHDFLVNGDANSDDAYRYAVMIENVPAELQTNARLREYMERLFPGNVRQVYVVQDTTELDKLVDERQKNIEALEKVIAKSKAKPDKPAPKIKQGAGKCGCGGTKVEAIPFYEREIERLNHEIDQERSKEQSMIDKANKAGSSRLSFREQEDEDDTIGQEPGPKNGDSPPDSRSSTAFVTFTSMRSKQEAVQCELSDKAHSMDCGNAPTPNDIIWKNAAVTVKRQSRCRLIAAAVWIVVALFWAIPVTFVTGVANLNSLLATVGLPPLNSDTFYYGLISGLLPVLFLQLFMALLYMALEACAQHFIREKSKAQVDAYGCFWYMIFQFANLWLIIIGGSAFNQLGALVENPSSIANLLASALPGATTFFINLVITSTFIYYAVELSQIIPLIIGLVMKCVRPKPKQPQRMLDERRTPKPIEWGKKLPPIIFVFLVTFVYMSIVPLLQLFSVAFFGIWYLVWKHNCLHVYAQETESGGLLWERISSFIMACLYTAEIIVCAYLGLKKAGGPAIFTLVVALIGTMIAHYLLRINVARPLQTISLELAAEFDEKRGGLGKGRDASSTTEEVEKLIYSQPTLKESEDERGPMPYRRKEENDHTFDADDEEAQGSDYALNEANSDSGEDVQVPMPYLRKDDKSTTFARVDEVSQGSENAVNGSDVDSDRAHSLTSYQSFHSAKSDIPVDELEDSELDRNDQKV